MSRKKDIDWNNDLDWVEPEMRFYRHFHYLVERPSYMDIFSDEDYKDYCDTIDKSIADDFDYTIEKYGTVKPKSFGKPDIYWD